MSTPSIDERALRTAGHTMIDGTSRPDALFQRVMDARTATDKLGHVPEVPAVIYDDPITGETLCRAVGPGLIVGRWSFEQDAERGADLAFPSLQTMSRPHFRIKEDQGRHVLTNLGSSGTFINGGAESVSTHDLRSGDSIYAAGLTLIFIR